MKIKTISLACLLGAMSIGFSSCLGEPENLTTFSIDVANLIIPDDVEKPVIADNSCTYSLRLDGVNNKLSVTTSNFAIDGKNETTFTTNEMNCIHFSALGYMGGTFSNGSATMANGNTVSNLGGFYTSTVYYYEVVGEPFKAVLANPMLIMQFKTKDATVKTFSLNPFFKGETVTTYEIKGEEQTFKTEDAVYRVNFSSDMKTANIALYNIRFAQQMPRPLQAVVLKNLPVKLTREGYVVELNEDTVPEMLESGELTPYPNYTFNHLRLATSSSDLTEAYCEYTVNGTFKGTFIGRSCANYQAQ